MLFQLSNPADLKRSGGTYPRHLTDAEIDNVPEVSQLGVELSRVVKGLTTRRALLPA
jgi:hypothetical protein